ncbi:hypothetical protein [Geitlerinema sp. PCC 9228]|uniref:hypothetical protein n=1 Tax=Geitlerinema sp. PCC 9228 TaxID=111611 RepID=UPI001114F562|nr:hypothetical protein [Geitlerinema sp. PCC 9228]
MRRMEDENDTTLTPDSFANGLGSEQLVLVEAPNTSKTSKKRKSKREPDRELEPIEVAASELAQFSLLRVQLQQAQEAAQPYVKLIEALFDPKPLSSEQMEMASSKEFARTLNNLAKLKVEYDAFHEKAAAAWELLKPAIAVSENAPFQSKENPVDQTQGQQQKPRSSSNGKNTPS